MSSARPAVGILIDLSMETSTASALSALTLAPSQSAISTPSATTVIRLKDFMCESAESKIKRLERAHLWEKISAQRWRTLYLDLRKRLESRPGDKSGPLESDANPSPLSTGVFQDLALLIDISEAPLPNPVSPPIVRPSRPSLFSRAITDITSEAKPASGHEQKQESVPDLRLTKLSIKTREQTLLIEQLKADLAASKAECGRVVERLNRMPAAEAARTRHSVPASMTNPETTEAPPKRTVDQAVCKAPSVGHPDQLPATNPGGHTAPKPESLTRLQKDLDSLRSNRQVDDTRMRSLEIRVTQHDIALSTPPIQRLPFGVNDLTTSWSTPETPVVPPTFQRRRIKLGGR